MKRIAFLILALSFLAPGCAWYRAKLGSSFTPETVSKIQPGVTTRAEVETALGAPDAVARLAGGDVYLYRYDEAKVFMVFLILANWGSLDVKPDRLLISFGTDGIVNHVAFRDRASTAEFRNKP